MPFKSDAQRRYFNANREKLEAEGVDVDEWNASSRGKKLPEKGEKKANWLKALARGTGNLLKTQVAPPLAAGAAGYLAAPAFQDMAGIESDMGREAQRLGTAAGAASLASPWLRNKLWTKNTLGRDLAKLMTQNPSYKNFGLNEIKKLHPEIGK